MTFQEKLDAITSKNNSLLCVGLDSDFDKIPSSFKKNNFPQFEFNKFIIGQTHDVVCAYKPGTAYYEERGSEGYAELKMTLDYLKENHPDIPVILDAKRADISNTNEKYAKFAFDWLNVDAITLHPYLGQEALRPFLDRKDKGCIILCRTSNPGGGEFQDLPVVQQTGPLPLYQYVAQQVVESWNNNGNCMLVVGATYPEQLVEVRKIAGDMTFLVPGIGTQGGKVEKTVKAGLNSKKAGMMINSSRGIIFSENPREEAKNLKDSIKKYR